MLRAMEVVSKESWNAGGLPMSGTKTLGLTIWILTEKHQRIAESTTSTPWLDSDGPSRYDQSMH